MAFRPLNFEEGKVMLVPAANATAIVKGNALTYASGLVTNAAGGQGTDVKLVAAETVTTTSAGQLIKAYPTHGTLFEADTDAAWSTVDQGTYADLAAAGTVDPDASADDLFFIIKGVGTAETDTKVIGYFNEGTPNS